MYFEKAEKEHKTSKKNQKNSKVVKDQKSSTKNSCISVDVFNPVSVSQLSYYY